MPFILFWNGLIAEKLLHFCRFYDILISSGREKIPENKFEKEVIKKYNDMIADLELDERLGVDIRYDKGKKYVLSDVVYDMAAILDVKLNMDIKGYIKIAE